MEKIKEILKARGSVYGDPKDNLKVTWELQYAYMEGIKRPVHIDGAHDVAINMVLLKIGRIATGTFCEDNYLDVMGWIEIARKIAKGEPTSPDKIGGEDIGGT